MLSVVFSVFASDVLGVDPVNQPFAFEQLDGAFAVAAMTLHQSFPGSYGAVLGL